MTWPKKLKIAVISIGNIVTDLMVTRE